MALERESWLSKAIVYQIYPRSFKDSNRDGVGDLRGITQRLDHVVELGANTIWLSPIYPSPMADFGYDVADYKNIDPIFGSLDDFRELLHESHQRGVKVLMDFIPNHSSNQHPWFLESESSKDNPKRDYYIWADPKDQSQPPNNWLSAFGGPAWEWDEETKQFYLHTFTKEQPDLNWRNPKLVEEMLGVLRFWLDLGIDGFRVDVPYHMFKDAELRDEPLNPNYITGDMDPYQQLIHIHTVGLPESLGMIGKFMDVLNQYNDKFLVTEAWTTDDELLRMYKKVDSHFFAPFNFHLLTMPFRAALHRDFIDSYDGALGNLYLPTYVFGNHDKPRLITRVGKEYARLAATLLFTLRGIPFIYYGEEIGMEDTPIPADKVQDPFEKNVPGMGLGRDPARTPMQWNKAKYAGFSEVEPWLPIPDSYKEVNVEEELKDPKSFLALYHKLIQIRQNSPALIFGKYVSWKTDNPDIFAYTRGHRDESVLVVLNYTGNKSKVALPFARAEIIFSTGMDKKDGTRVDCSKLNLRPYEGLVLKLL